MQLLFETFRKYEKGNSYNSDVGLRSLGKCSGRRDNAEAEQDEYGGKGVEY